MFWSSLKIDGNECVCARARTIFDETHEKQIVFNYFDWQVRVRVRPMAACVCVYIYEIRQFGPNKYPFAHWSHVSICSPSPKRRHQSIGRHFGFGERIDWLTIWNTQTPVAINIECSLLTPIARSSCRNYRVETQRSTRLTRNASFSENRRDLVDLFKIDSQFFSKSVEFDKRWAVHFLCECKWSLLCTEV